MLTTDQITHYLEHGWLRIPQVFTPDETGELADSLDEVVGTWATEAIGWTGPWRKVYMDAETETVSKLIALHDLHLFSGAWSRCVTNPRLVAAMVDLLGPDVELNHSTLHAKPPGTGQPFPMHQDYPFYPHTNDKFVDVLVHLDDTNAENGEIRFLDGSHKLGPIAHVTANEDGTSCTPHLPTDQWKLEDTVAVPAKAGDVVVFNINTIHGSYINRTDRVRRMVRLGYRTPDNIQLGGVTAGKSGWMVAGMRSKRTGDTAWDVAFGSLLNDKATV